MKNILIALLMIFAFVACKNETKETPIENLDDPTTLLKKEERAARYNSPIAKTLLAHGGLKKWDHMNNLCYEMEGSGGKEVHTTSLKDRMSKIEHKDWSIGYDGADVWLQNNEKDAYQGNARFYHNLMFYFYAMPFVLADDGITYTKMPQATLVGEKYDTVKISYGADVGDSPEDEYILYSDPTSGRMEWLAYTVTFKSGEKSSDWHYIKYSDWQQINGLQLPKKLTWYNADENGPTDVRNDLEFDKVTATETVIPAAVFAKPEGGVVVER
jgi:hypothetical protein